MTNTKQKLPRMCYFPLLRRIWAQVLKITKNYAACRDCYDTIERNDYIKVIV